MLFRSLRALGLGLSLAGASLSGLAPLEAEERTAPLASLSMTMSPVSLATGASAREPMGWTDFCKRYQGECEPPQQSLLQQASLKNPAVYDIVFDEFARQEISRVNSAVNAEIAPATDREMWGMEERWDFPANGRGDCEDYVLLKRARLMAAGFPRSALLITVVTDLQGDGHAVLTLKTDRGDYILDNMNDQVILWRDTPYGFVKRQSQSDQNAWVSLGGGKSNPVLVSR